MTPTLKDIGTLWNEINAIGGSGTARTEWEAGANGAIDQALLKIETRFAHYHVAGPNDFCAACGLHLYQDIHIRTKIEAKS